MTSPVASHEDLNTRMIEAIAAASPPHGTRDPRVLAAIRAVRRGEFVPGADPGEAYNPELAVITKRGPAGNALSCASVPTLVAAMLAALAIEPGDHIFEAGAGTGWNAALMAELAGPDGAVSTIDIAPDVADDARANLARAGFGRVHVATGDAAEGIPDNAPYDRAIVTIGALDLPPEWARQLRPGGRIVVPLRWRGQTQALALDLGDDGVFRSADAWLCGFVPMIGQDWELSASIDPHDLVRLYWDADQDIVPSRLAGVLDSPATRIESGVMVGPEESLDPIWLRATATDPAVCRIAATSAAVTKGLCIPSIPARTLALAEGESVAYIAHQKLPAPERGARLAAIGHGPAGEDLAGRLCHHVSTWGDNRSAKPRVTIYPPDAAPRQEGTQVIAREHCEMTVSYQH